MGTDKISPVGDWSRVYCFWTVTIVGFATHMWHALFLSYVAIISFPCASNLPDGPVDAAQANTLDPAWKLEIYLAAVVDWFFSISSRLSRQVSAVTSQFLSSSCCHLSGSELRLPSPPPRLSNSQARRAISPIPGSTGLWPPSPHTHLSWFLAILPTVMS